MQGFFIVMPASEKVPLVIIVGPLLLAEMHDRGMITRGWQQARTHTLQKTAIFRRPDSFQGAQNRALVGAPQLCTHMRSGQRTADGNKLQKASFALDSWPVTTYRPTAMLHCAPVSMKALQLYRSFISAASSTQQQHQDAC